MEDNLLHLKKTHSYYYQIQGTMGITGAAECDFMVWTTISVKVETISFEGRYYVAKTLSFTIIICFPL